MLDLQSATRWLCLLVQPAPLCLPHCRSINPYVANSFAGWAVPHRLPIQSAPAAPANAGTSSFGMSGVNAHAIITPRSTEVPATAGALPSATWQRSLRCFVEVLVPLHPLLGAAVKVRCLCHKNLCDSTAACQQSNASTVWIEPLTRITSAGEAAAAVPRTACPSCAVLPVGPSSPGSSHHAWRSLL